MALLMFPTPQEILNIQEELEKPAIESQVQKLMDIYNSWLTLQYNPDHGHPFSNLVANSGLQYTKFLQALKAQAIVISVEGYNQVAVDLFLKEIQKFGSRVETTRYSPTYVKTVNINPRNHPNIKEIHKNWQQVLCYCYELDLEILKFKIESQMMSPTPLTVKSLDWTRPLPQFSVDVSDAFPDVVNLLISSINHDPHWSASFYQESEKHGATSSVIITPKPK